MVKKIRKYKRSPRTSPSPFILTGLLLFEIAIVGIYLGSILLFGQPYPPFDMNGQMTIPSLLQALQMFIIGLLSLILFIREKPSQLPPSPLFKLTIAILLIYGAIDEVFKIHLQLKDWFPGLGNRGWMAIYLVIFLMTPFVFIKDIVRLWQMYRRETSVALLGMILFGLGGFGAELFKDIAFPLLSPFVQQEILLFFIEKVRIAFEEFWELAGESLILYATLLFVSKRRHQDSKLYS